jgi:hypothetical protein
MGDHLVVVDHNTQRVSRQTGSGWETVVEPGCGGFSEASHAVVDYRYVNFAASDEAMYMHDAQGGLWRAVPGGRWEQVAPPVEGPEPRYSRRVALAWDRPTERLVLFGSPEQNDTWVYEEGAWREFDDERRPAKGIASIAATDRGTYLLAGHDLWRLTDHRWECVGSDPEWQPRGLLWDPTRDRLITFGPSWEGAEVLTWEDRAWRQIATGPAETQICETMSGMSAEAGIDPAGDRLLLLHADMDWELDLGRLDLPSAALPTDPVEPQAATGPAPEDDLTTAYAIEMTEGEAVAGDEVPVDLIIPEGWLLVALIPRVDGGPIPEPYTGLAVLYVEDPWAGDDEPWRLDGGGIEVRMLQGETPPFLVSGYQNKVGVLSPAEFVEFSELPPEQRDQYNSPGGGADEMANGSKLGGYPRYIQGEPRGLLDRPDLSFLGQLGPEIFDCLFGDAGSAYLYIGKDGETGAVVQSH